MPELVIRLVALLGGVLVGVTAWASTSARRAQMTTRAPSRPNEVAAARPMPSLPPVTTATLSLSPRSTDVL